MIRSYSNITNLPLNGEAKNSYCHPIQRSHTPEFKTKENVSTDTEPDTSNALIAVCHSDDKTAAAIIGSLDSKTINSAVHRSLEEKKQTALNNLARKSDQVFSIFLEKISPDLLSAWIIKKTFLTKPRQISRTVYTMIDN